VAGTFSFGLMETLTGSMRASVLSIIIFFITGLVFFLIIIGIERREPISSKV
jgi:UMF1 family MFS transporter